MNQRQSKINEFYTHELSELTEKIYNESLLKYPDKYIPIGSTSDGKNLFKEIEKYLLNEYDIPFKLNKHFDFHSERVFFSPTNNFGFTSKINNCEELASIFPEYKRGNYYYSIFEDLYPNKKLSKIIQTKINTDTDLEIELIKNELKAYFKRFFLLGGYNLFWITIDQLNHFGIDKYPDCLNTEIKTIDYSIKFHLAMNGIGESADEYGITKSKKSQKIQAEKEKIYYLSLKNKGQKNINYIDVLMDPQISETINFNELGFTIYAKQNDLKCAPILKINNNKFKQYRSETFKNKVLERRKNADDYCLIDYNRIEFSPYCFPKNFKLEPDDVIKNQSLLQEYLQSYNEPENEVRALLNLPKIGEGWISETNLYYEIKNHFHSELVVQHGKPHWLEKQHFDVFLPKHNIAIEYQGDQHYYPIDFFGGEAAFVKNKIRDEKKKHLSKENNCYLIYVNPNYKIENIIDEIEDRINKTKNK